MYEHGQGVAQNYAGAMSWYRKAADQGDAAAQTSVGSMHAMGHGVTTDYVEAIKWYRMAALQGDATAQCNVASLYATGRGVQQDPAMALKWYLRRRTGRRRRAEPWAAYATGQGVPGLRAAMSWYLKAARRATRAQNNLGSLFAAGKAVPRDLVHAHKWYTLAAAHFRLKSHPSATRRSGTPTALRRRCRRPDRRGAAPRPRMEAQ
jgi:TPR repeat protein